MKPTLSISLLALLAPTALARPIDSPSSLTCQCNAKHVSVAHLRALIDLHSENDNDNDDQDLRLDFDNRPQKHPVFHRGDKTSLPTPLLDVDRPIPTEVLLNRPGGNSRHANTAARHRQQQHGVDATATPPSSRHHRHHHQGSAELDELEACLRKLDARHQRGKSGLRQWEDWILAAAMALFLVAVVLVELAERTWSVVAPYVPSAIQTPTVVEQRGFPDEKKSLPIAMPVVEEEEPAREFLCDAWLDEKNASLFD